MTSRADISETMLARLVRGHARAVERLRKTDVAKERARQERTTILLALANVIPADAQSKRYLDRAQETIARMEGP